MGISDPSNLPKGQSVDGPDLLSTGSHGGEILVFGERGRGGEGKGESRRRPWPPYKYWDSKLRSPSCSLPPFVCTIGFERPPLLRRRPDHRGGLEISAGKLLEGRKVLEEAHKQGEEERRRQYPG